MGRKAGRVARASERRLECQPTQTRTLVMQRRMDLGLALETCPEFSGPCVDPAPLGQRNAAIDRITQELVLEVEHAARTWRIEDEVVHQLLEGRLDRLGMAVP